MSSVFSELNINHSQTKDDYHEKQYISNSHIYLYVACLLPQGRLYNQQARWTNREVLHTSSSVEAQESDSTSVVRDTLSIQITARRWSDQLIRERDQAKSKYGPGSK